MSAPKSQGMLSAALSSPAQRRTAKNLAWRSHTGRVCRMRKVGAVLERLLVRDATGLSGQHQQYPTSRASGAESEDVVRSGLSGGEGLLRDATLRPRIRRAATLVACYLQHPESPVASRTKRRSRTAPTFLIRHTRPVRDLHARFFAVLLCAGDERAADSIPWLLGRGGLGLFLGRGLCAIELPVLVLPYAHSRAPGHPEEEGEGALGGQDGVKGGGTFLAWKTNLADEDAVKRLSEAFKSGEMTNEIDMNDLLTEPVELRGQMRFFRKTGRRMMGITDKEIESVKKAVKETIQGAGGNPSLITATALTYGLGKAPFILIANIDIEMVQTVFDMIQLEAQGITWGIRAHNIGNIYQEARFSWKPMSRKGAQMRMKARDAEKYFWMHPATSMLVEEVVFTYDRLHPTTEVHQLVRPAYNTRPRAQLDAMPQKKAGPLTKRGALPEAKDER
ncbi:hypothetical protein CYMTET_23794 [Cymbomonas tetramitiformis]|uniref:Uncharacterized protein n=1 Tax=Cymbomonas tetramitiformis TaxID=36881 RepID=A0AAE0FYL0_9CHLO|nr:hypothetical protein CYMTET_23794 [Cymbomonas tetramitiformis]